jgi:hypothetical protein
MPAAEGDWPRLELNEWQDTCATLHLWTQVVGSTSTLSITNWCCA